MGNALTVIGLFFSVAVPIAAHGADPVPVTGNLLTDPVWKTQPDERELRLYYPDRAFRLGLNGFAIVTCTVNDVGMLASCRIYGEEPKGQAFGIALTKMARLVQIEPTSAGGTPTSGRTIRLGSRYTAMSSVDPSKLIVELVTIQQ